MLSLDSSLIVSLFLLSQSNILNFAYVSFTCFCCLVSLFSFLAMPPWHVEFLFLDQESNLCLSPLEGKSLNHRTTCCLVFFFFFKFIKVVYVLRKLLFSNIRCRLLPILFVLCCFVYFLQFLSFVVCLEKPSPM